MSKVRSVIVLVALCAAAMSQTKILLYDFEARGVDVSVVRTCTQVLRDALNGTYKYAVIDPAPGTFCYNVVAAADSARKYNASQALVGNIMAIGGKRWLTYQLVDAVSSAVMLADKFELPPLDEFPEMADRLANSLVEKKPYSATIEPEKVTTPEIAPRFKHPRQPYAGIFLTAGYLYPMTKRQFTYTKQGDTTPHTADMSSSLINLNVAASFETQQMLTMLQMGLMRGNHEERDLNFDLLSHFVMGTGDFAPVVGGGIGVTRFSWQTTEAGIKKTAHNDGLSLSAGAGLLGLRTYYFRLLLAAYGNLTLASNDWYGQPNTTLVPGARIAFGVSTPSLGPDATLKMNPGCVGAIIGGFFLTGLIIALVS